MVETTGAPLSRAEYQALVEQAPIIPGKCREALRIEKICLTVVSATRTL
jgi:hypothetical protein